MEEIMNLEPQLSHIPLLKKWLRLLMYISLTGLVLAALTLIPGAGTLLKWVSYLVSGVGIYVLFRMSPACDRYRKSALLRCAYLVGTVLAILLASWGILGSLASLTGSICGIIASYQEYHGHADVVEPFDKVFSGKWHSLFTWQILVGVLVGLGSVVGVVLSVFNGGTVSVELTVALISIPSVILQAVYLTYLNRMGKLLQ